MRSSRGHTSSRGARRTLVCRAAAEDDDDEIPDEVWEAEAKSAPARNIRLGVYAFVGLGASLLAAGRISALTDTRTGPLGEIMQPSVFGILLDIFAIGVAAYFAMEDLKNRDANVKRIWEEVKARKAAGPTKSASTSSSKGFGGGASSSASSGKSGGTWEKAPAQSGKVSTETVETDSNPGEEKSSNGLFSGLTSLIDQANTDARIQALQINNKLEDAGVLEKLPTSTSSSSDAPDEEASTPVASQQPSAQKQPESQNRKKGKKGKKRGKKGGR